MRILLLLAAPLLLSAPIAVQAQDRSHDFPTQARVVYVEQCMAENPGPHYEMVAKCSCTLDRLAEAATYDDFVSMQTSTNASTIAGERGNAIRDDAGLQKDVRTFRTLQEAAKKSCFVGLPHIQ